MADDDVLANIQQLADEEHELYERHRAGTPLSDDEHRRLNELQVRLDQCWDLLRQRRARREFVTTRRRRVHATSRPSRAISSRSDARGNAPPSPGVVRCAQFPEGGP
jgi:Protein of unknown function (DUF2630)